MRVERGEAGRKARGWLVGDQALSPNTFPDIFFPLHILKDVGSEEKEGDGGPPGKRFREVFRCWVWRMRLGGWRGQPAPPPVNPRPPPDQPQLQSLHQQLLLFLLYWPTPKYEQVSHIHNSHIFFFYHLPHMILILGAVQIRFGLSVGSQTGVDCPTQHTFIFMVCICWCFILKLSWQISTTLIGELVWLRTKRCFLHILERVR